MKKQLLSLTVIFMSIVSAAAQTVLYEQDFETAPFTEWEDLSGDDLEEGSPACGKAGVGTAAEVSSTNVDFEPAANATSFMVVNPESPCGGYYGTALFSDPINVSGVTQLYFKGRYFRSSTINYGFTSFSFTFDDGSTVTTFDDAIDFTVRDSWAYFSLSLPASYITSGSIEMSINISAGEAIALDDLETSDFPDIITAVDEATANDVFSVYPTVTNDKVFIEAITGVAITSVSLMDLNGTIILGGDTTQEMDVSWLDAGMYIVKVVDDKGNIYSYRIIKG